MNLDILEKKLIAAARRDDPARAQVPYAFAQRVAAQLPARAPAPRALHWWCDALWRAAAPCLGIALGVAGWAWFQPETNSTAADFSDQIENVLFAVADGESGAAETSW